MIRLDTSEARCPHGIHKQPSNGPFSVYIFCDDAAGTNIGIVLTEPGAGPGNLKIPGPTKIWHWYPYERFWQDKEWAADITSFAWSPSLRYAYVATSFVYGDGGVFKLDLMNRRAVKLKLKTIDRADLEQSESGSSISSIDIKKKILYISTWYFDTKLKKDVEIKTSVLLE